MKCIHRVLCKNGSYYQVVAETGQPLLDFLSFLCTYPIDASTEAPTGLPHRGALVIVGSYADRRHPEKNAGGQSNFRVNSKP